MDVHGEVQLVANDLLVLAGEFIGAVDALGVPVSPVEAVLKHCDGKRVGQAYTHRERQRLKKGLEMFDEVKTRNRPTTFFMKQ